MRRLLLRRLSEPGEKGCAYPLPPFCCYFYGTLGQSMSTIPVWSPALIADAE